MSEFKGGDRGVRRSDLDHRTTYDGRFWRYFNTDQNGGDIRLAVVAALIAGGLLALRFIGQDVQISSVIEAKGHQYDEKQKPSPVDELTRSRTTYNARAEACFRTGQCDDPKAAEVWRKMKELGYVDGFISTIPEDSDGSPKKVILTGPVGLLRMPGSCGLPDQNIIARGLQGKVVPTTQRYEVRKADGEIEGVYLLIDPRSFPKNSKPVPTWIETKPRNC